MFESSLFYTCASTSSPYIIEDPSGAKGLEGPEWHSQRPRSSCWSQGDNRPRWRLRDEEPLQSQKDRGTVFYIWVICASYLCVRYISFHFLSSSSRSCAFSYFKFSCIIFSSQRCKSVLSLGVPIVWSPYRITPIHWLMARMSYSTFLRRLLMLANALSAPQISLPSRSGHISPSVAIFLARFWIIFLGILHLHFNDCGSGTLFSLRWSAIEYCRCQPPCSCFIVSDDPHSKCVKCMGFSHACEAVHEMSILQNPPH